MIFLGDVAHPHSNPPQWVDMRRPWDPGNAVVFNLEGTLVHDVDDHIRRRVLVNHESLLGAAAAFGVQAACLANNHITDLPGGISATKALLKRRGILSFGAGENLSEAVSPALLGEGPQTVALIGFGWQAIQCKGATREGAGVAPLDADIIFAALTQSLAAAKEVIVVMHWNYEMELYPQPAHRQLAMELIDRGAAAVIGHHTHCVGGIEMYKGSPIVYSLGNWWMPHGIYFNGRLSYSDASTRQLAFEWNTSGRFACHWFDYDPVGHSLSWDSSEGLADSTRIAALTPFDGMPHDDYQKWFQKNRRKNKLLPIYADYRDRRTNLLRDAWLGVRGSGVVRLRQIQSYWKSRV
jgi:poly-gamma-glutamate synthesis protein (capsule biosynthesis protein)